jgi:hypothetical protein
VRPIAAPPDGFVSVWKKNKQNPVYVMHCKISKAKAGPGAVLRV